MRAFRTLDDELLTRARADGLRDGCTALAVARLGSVLYAAHCGDSRAVRGVFLLLCAAAGCAH